MRAGEHRLAIGDMWDELGELQLSFMRAHGLRPGHTLLDIGCGSLRGGIRFVDYLDSGNYFGLDVNQSLLDAGYEIELSEVGLEKKLPRENLLCSGDFEVGRFNRRFDFALAISLFTHLTLNHFAVCLERLAAHLEPRGMFFATYFEAPPSQPRHLPHLQQPGGLTTHATEEPYHYRYDDLAAVAKSVGWSAEAVSDFDHPRNQKMLALHLESFSLE